jgi:hypothetical protein
VINETAKMSKKEDKIRVLREHQSWALKDILRGTYEAKLEWNLPKGEPPYEACEPHNCPANLIRENKKFKYFVKGIKESDNLPGFKRERVFLGMLESVHPEDAKLLIGMINKNKIKGITEAVIEEAFPGLIKK